MWFLYKLLGCHFIGDYILQTDFIAKTKGENWWHLIVPCVLYSIPFSIVFGTDYKIIIIICSHIIIDSLKARYKVINYMMDQILHCLIMYIVYIYI